MKLASRLCKTVVFTFYGYVPMVTYGWKTVLKELPLKLYLNYLYNVIAQNQCRITLNVLLCNSLRSNGIHVSQRKEYIYYKYSDIITE